MPFQSEQQRRYMWANHPEIARKWAHESGSKPMKKSKKKKAIKQLADAFTMSRTRRRRPESRGFAFDAILQLSRDDSDSLTTKDPLVFWKEVAHVGTFHKGDQRIDITPRHLSHWENTHKAMSKAGLTVPVPVEHTKDPERRRGKVLELAQKTNSRGLPALYAKIRFRDSDAAKMIDSGVSIFVPKESQSGYGHRFVAPVEHVAITDYPVIPDLEPFAQALSLSWVGFEREETPPVAELDDRGMFNPHRSPLVIDAMSRQGALDGITLAFPPEGAAKSGDSGSDKPTDKPSPAPNQQSGQQQPPATATQQLTLRDLATQLGIDQSITDEQQLLTQLSNVIMQLKARAQAPMPPQYPPGQQPQMMRPSIPPSPMAGQPHPPGAPGPYGPPAMHTGRPPVAMSQRRDKVRRKEFLQLSLDDIPEDILMALSKKQMKKLVKVVKGGKKGKVSGNKDYVQKLNDKSHFGTTEDTEGGDYDDTYKDENNDAFDNGEDNEDNEDEFNGKGSAGKLSMAGGMALSGTVLDAVKNARTVTIDSLFSRGFLTGNTRKQMLTDYVQGQGVAFSHQYDDGFDKVVKMLEGNGPVMNRGKTGVQGSGKIVELSNGAGDPVNPLVADAERRAEGKSNL